MVMVVFGATRSAILDFVSSVFLRSQMGITRHCAEAWLAVAGGVFFGGAKPG